MSEIDYDARQRILDLEARVAELQAMTLLTLSELRALQETTIAIWQREGVISDESQDIPTVLASMRDEILQDLVAAFADKDMNRASRLMQNIQSMRQKHDGTA